MGLCVREIIWCSLVLWSVTYDNTCVVKDKRYYGNIWKYMKIFENIWKYMKIYENIWKLIERPPTSPPKESCHICHACYWKKFVRVLVFVCWSRLLIGVVRRDETWVSVWQWWCEGCWPERCNDICCCVYKWCYVRLYLYVSTSLFVYMFLCSSIGFYVYICQCLYLWSLHLYATTYICSTSLCKSTSTCLHLHLYVSISMESTFTEQ